jgi:hypothetical protein
MDNDSRLIWEAYSSYKLPGNGQMAFGDFYLLELLLHKTNTDTNIRSSHITDQVRELFENMTYQLGTTMLQYMKASILDEFLYIDDKTNFGWIYNRYKNPACSYTRDDKAETKKCIYAQIHQFIDDMVQQGNDITTYDYIIPVIDKIYENYGDNIVHTLCKFIARYNTSENSNNAIVGFDDTGFIDYFDNGEYDETNKAWSSLPQGIIETVMYDSDNTLKWEPSYGGKLWGDAVKECRELELILKDYNINKLAAKIDHIYDLEHNSGSLLNKSDRVRVPKHVLDHRANAKSIEDLASKVYKSKTVGSLLSKNGINPSYISDKPGSQKNVQDNLLSDLLAINKPYML